MNWLGALVTGLLTGIETWWNSRKASPEPDPVKPPGFDDVDARIAAELAAREAREATTVKTPRDTVAPTSAKSNPY